MRSWKVRVLLCGFTCYWIAIINICSCEKRVQLVLEHPTITYINSSYLSNLTIITKRYSRKDPTRYLNMYTITKKPFDRSYSIYFNFFELLSNVYKPTFVTLHFDNYCDMIEKDTFIGSTIVAAYIKSNVPKDMHVTSIKCPFPAGTYVYENITIPYNPILKRFPFTNGRIFINVTCNRSDEVVSLFIDMAIK